MSAFELRVVSAEQFAAVDEEGAAPLVGDTDSILIPEGGIVVPYGNGGAGKTTLSIDLGCHLAGGVDWLDIPINHPRRVLLIEDEGPRPPFRAKLRRKLAAWPGPPLGDRISVLEEPWALFSFAEPADREALASVIREREIDVVIVGPITAAGMNAAGTLQEVREFAALVTAVGHLSGRRVTFILIHHENKGGQVSGAWEGCCDTLLHVSNQGHGKTRVHIQKARWSSQHHGTTMQLRWTDGDGFELEDKPQADDDQIAEEILTYIAENPGAGWTRVEEGTPGHGRDKRRGVRDQLLRDGKLVNIGKDEDGLVAAIDYVPERQPARLYLPTDATIIPLRPAPGAAPAQTPDAPAPCASALKRRRGVGAADAPGDNDLERLLAQDPGSHILDIDDWANNLEEPSDDLAPATLNGRHS
jgi:hypothetical protein